MADNGLTFARHMARVSQARMAEEMGIPIRTYEDIESGRTKYRPIHKVAAEMARIKIAAETGDLAAVPMYLWPTLAKVSKLLAPHLDENGELWWTDRD